MKLLEKLSMIAVLCVSAVVLFVVIRDHRAASSKGPQKFPFVGQRLAKPPFTIGASGATIVLAVSTNCKFCAESVPFYKELLRIRDRSESQLRVVSFFPQSADIATEYVHHAELQPDEVVSAPLGQIGVRGTPTVILINSKGVVEQAWIGMLDHKRQNELLAKLQSLCNRCIVSGHL